MQSKGTYLSVSSGCKQLSFLTKLEMLSIDLEAFVNFGNLDPLSCLRNLRSLTLTKTAVILSSSLICACFSYGGLVLPPLQNLGPMTFLSTLTNLSMLRIDAFYPENLPCLHRIPLSVEVLHIHSAMQLPDDWMLPLTRLQNLRALQLVLCVDMSSVRFLKPLTQLEYLSLRLAETIKEYSHAQRRAYWHQVEKQLESTLSKRGHPPEHIFWGWTSSFFPFKICQLPIQM